MATTASQLRLMSDLKAIQQSPPDGVSASPLSDDNVSAAPGGALVCTVQPPMFDALKGNYECCNLIFLVLLQLFVWGASILGPPDTPW